LLVLGLLSPLEPAFLKAPVDTNGQVVRDLGKEKKTQNSGEGEQDCGGTYTNGNVNNLLETDVSESGIDDVGWETEDCLDQSSATIRCSRVPLELTSLSDLGGTRVLIIKSSDEGERFASSIDLVVDGTLGEERSLALGHSVEDESSTTLFDETGFHRRAIHSVQELGRPRVSVRGVHTARAGMRMCFRKGWVREQMEAHLRHFDHSHGQAVGEQGGEVCDARETHGSTSTFTHSSGKIEQPLGTDNVNMLDCKFGRYHRRCSLTSLLLLRTLRRATWVGALFRSVRISRTLAASLTWANAWKAVPRMKAPMKMGNFMMSEVARRREERRTGGGWFWKLH